MQTQRTHTCRLVGAVAFTPAVRTFPNPGNPNTILVQSISATMTLTPLLGGNARPIGGADGASVFALNSVKFDPGTFGTCPSTASSPKMVLVGWASNYVQGHMLVVDGDWRAR